MKNKSIHVILNLLRHEMGSPLGGFQDLFDFPIKLGMTRWSVLLFFVLGVSVLFFLTQHSGAQEQNQQVYDVACEVKDVPTLKDCIQQAKDKKTDLIKITSIVECISKDDCEIDMSDMTTPLKMYGISNTETGFKRIGQFDYSLFTFKNNHDIVIGSFMIDDSSVGDCAALGAPCPPAIVFEGTKDSMIDQLRTLNTKGTSVSILSSKNIVIKNSVFNGSQNHSLVVSNGTSVSRTIQVEQNTFTDSGSNALIFSASDGKNSIRQNTFTHNHKDSLYDGCVGVCTASQLRILPFTKDILIEKNTISDGSIDTYTAFGLYASGIEIAPQLVENATLRCNKIFSNTGNGVVIPDRTASTKTINMTKNSIYNNGINVNFYLQPDDNVQNNCFDASCKVDGC